MVKFELGEYHRDVTDDELLEDLRRVASKIDTNSISAATYELRGGIYHCSTFQRRFGSWNKALTNAGLIVAKRYKIPDEEMFGNLESVWRHLGHQPRYVEICKPLSIFSARAYEKRFGSWRKALEAFISFINKAEQDSDVPVEEILGVETIGCRTDFLA